MKNLDSIQQALINIFKVSIEESSLAELVCTCHEELKKLMGGKKTENFYLALYVGDYNYFLPYYKDEKDKDPIDEAISLKGGLTDYIRRTGRTELVDTDRHRTLMHEGKVDVMVGSDSYEWVGAPLSYKNEVHGVLVVQTYDNNVHYSKEDVELLDYVSKNIALTIERKSKDQEIFEYKENLERKVREKSKEILKKNAKLKRKIAKIKKSEKIQKVLYNISESKSKTKNLRELLTKIHEQVEILMDAPNFYVAIIEDKKEALYRFPYIVDENPQELEDPDDLVKLSGGLTHYVLKTETPLLVDEQKILNMIEHKVVIQVGKHSMSWLGIPLKTDGGEILGIVAVQSYTDPQAYTLTDKKVLSIISATIAGAVKYKQLEEEKNALEEKLLESQKMEAVGILAAGVAHEFNNLLSVILGHAYNGIRDTDKESKNHKRFTKIEKSSERAAKLVDKLLIFAQKRERGRFFIKEMPKAINEAIVKIKSKAPGVYEIVSKIQPALWPVKIDQEDLEEMFANILDNALRAVYGKEGGSIKITAENFRGKPGTSPVKRAAKYIYIKIEDNGHGMSEETRANIFHPFFTTREPGEGTGLGLAIVYAIIQEYYGAIDVESKLDEGTAIHIYLPTTPFLH
ncbi:MAG: GAF domain-containing protein [bacterium]|nr:GAF domain-containing protein [bacterium]